MVEGTGRRIPDLDPELLLTHLEYAAWATRKTIAMVDELPPDAVTKTVNSSFPGILATLQHVYGGDLYYFTHLQGGSIEPQDVKAPDTYDELKAAWTKLHADMREWAKAHLADARNDVIDAYGVFPVWMAVMQIASHATHHLGQIVTLLRQAGYEPSDHDLTDLIFYYLRRYPQPNQKAQIARFLE